MLYTIWERYEYRSSKGVEWTKWFQLFNVKPTENKDELKDKLKEFKESNKYVSSKTSGLRIENKIDEYVAPPIIEKKKRGRPKKQL